MSDQLDELNACAHPPFERVGSHRVRYGRRETLAWRLVSAALGIALAGVSVVLAVSRADSYSYGKTLPDKGHVWTVILRHVDGDTVQLGSIVDEGTARLLDIDAPEMRGKTQAERDAAQASKKRLAELLPINSVWRTEVQGHDGFDRPLVRFIREDGKTVNQQLIDEGHAKEYRR